MAYSFRKTVIVIRLPSPNTVNMDGRTQLIHDLARAKYKPFDIFWAYKKTAVTTPFEISNILSKSSSMSSNDRPKLSGIKDRNVIKLASSVTAQIESVSIQKTRNTWVWCEMITLFF